MLNLAYDYTEDYKLNSLYDGRTGKREVQLRSASLKETEREIERERICCCFVPHVNMWVFLCVCVCVLALVLVWFY